MAITGATKHDYFCEDGNAYDRNMDYFKEWETWGDFINEFGGCAILFNLVVRFDIYQKEDGETFCINMQMLHQRKGYIFTHWITSADKEDLKSLEQWLKPHYEYLKELWSEFEDDQ